MLTGGGQDGRLEGHVPSGRGRGLRRQNLVDGVAYRPLQPQGLHWDVGVTEFASADL